MKLLVLSDLHLEFADFEPDREAAEAADVVVLAGDIHQGTAGMAWARQTFPDKPIIYVAGNHEFYGQHLDALLPELRQKAGECGVHFLENDAVTIDGMRFLGATLWTDFDMFGRSRRSQNMRSSEGALNDFRLIKAETIKPEQVQAILTLQDGKKGAVRWTRKLTAVHTLARHQESMAWLRTELPKGDPDKTIVVTHHYPHKNSCTPQWANDPVSSIFGSKLPNEILLGAKLWIHGHTHDSSDYRIGDSTRSVRIVCNPRGYPLGGHSSEMENARFNPKLLVEV